MIKPKPVQCIEERSFESLYMEAQKLAGYSPVKGVTKSDLLKIINESKQRNKRISKNIA